MAKSKVKISSAGARAVLNSGEVAAMIVAAAGDVRSEVDYQIDGEVVVDTYTTDRAAASVTIRDVRGKLWQARDGVLTQAAASAGLEVKAR